MNRTKNTLSVTRQVVSIEKDSMGTVPLLRFVVNVPALVFRGSAPQKSPAVDNTARIKIIIWIITVSKVMKLY